MAACQVGERHPRLFGPVVLCSLGLTAGASCSAFRHYRHASAQVSAWTGCTGMHRGWLGEGKVGQREQS